MYDCYLSPQGEIYCGMSHFTIAEHIPDKVYGLNEDSIHDPNLTMEQFAILSNPEKFLEEQGWMKYINRCSVGWWIHSTKRPTQAQIDKAWEESHIDVSKMGSSC